MHSFNDRTNIYRSKQELYADIELSGLMNYESRRGNEELNIYDKYFEYTYFGNPSNSHAQGRASPLDLWDSHAPVRASINVHKSTLEKTGFYKSGTLPHYDIKYKFQFITLREYGSIPQSILKTIEDKTIKFNEDFLKYNSFTHYERQIRIQHLRLKLFEKYQDCGYGRCLFKKKEIANIIKEALLFYNDKNYEIISWVIMPNHIHLLVYLYPNYELAKFIHYVKSITTNKIKKYIDISEKIWSNDYFDRYIRNHFHYCKTVNYIRMNPVKAGLCKDYQDWKFTDSHAPVRASGSPSMVDEI